MTSTINIIQNTLKFEELKSADWILNVFIAFITVNACK